MKYVIYMEDVCNFAMISKYFYRLTNTDFKSLCYKNVVYRLDNETWASAFSLTNYRTLDIKLNSMRGISFSDRTSFCSHTGTLAIILKLKQVLVTNIDFGRKVFRIINLAKVKGPLVNIHLMNKATQLLLDTKVSYVVYDLVQEKIVKTYSALRHERYNAFTLYYNSGILVDLCNQKDYKLELGQQMCSISCRPILNTETQGYRKYVGYWKKLNELVLIDNSTGQRTVICTIDSLSTICILDRLDQVVEIRLCDTNLRHQN
ncbi:unnamed protein product [Bursaphelenchus okinawaensis]|uniref:Uncharacterized protein n=1 Tax=Bursaphelenchus okinawaensis TaxID=465554 RepID=A0A811KVC8_9BILA|nr:unnamed protein product [Bursaphelenchus okinawaensis]CAG9112490.1 unnamed protein product [Bursaphelenchus okinawaensis]